MIKKIWTQNNIVAYEFCGKLSDADYALFVPQIESMLDHFKKLRILVIFRDFEGWEVRAMWENIKFNFKNNNSFERIAFVGENKCEYCMSVLCKAMTNARVKYFEVDSTEAALSWLEEEPSKTPSEPLVTPY
jgi:hypothetical protein